MLHFTLHLPRVVIPHLSEFCRRSVSAPSGRKSTRWRRETSCGPVNHLLGVPWKAEEKLGKAFSKRLIQSCVLLTPWYYKINYYTFKIHFLTLISSLSFHSLFPDAQNKSCWFESTDSTSLGSFPDFLSIHRLQLPLVLQKCTAEQKEATASAPRISTLVFTYPYGLARGSS